MRASCPIDPITSISSMRSSKKVEQMSRLKAICDRIYAVGGPGLSAPEDAFVYLVDAGNELVLIDAGVGYGIGRIEDNIRDLGI